MRKNVGFANSEPPHICPLTNHGRRLTKGVWKLVPKRGKRRKFSGPLLATLNLGKRRNAVFSIPKRFK